MSTFIETDHPRGHATNPGGFVEKPHSAPEIGLTEPAARKVGPNGPIPVVGSRVRVGGYYGVVRQIDNETFVVQLLGGDLTLASVREVLDVSDNPADREIRLAAVANIQEQDSSLNNEDRTLLDDLEAASSEDETLQAARTRFTLSHMFRTGAVDTELRETYNGLLPLEYGAQDAAAALIARHLVGRVPGWTQTDYDLLTRPWRTVVGPIHPDDDGVASGWIPDWVQRANPYMRLVAAIRG